MSDKLPSRSTSQPCVALTPDIDYRIPLTVLLTSLSHHHRSAGCRIFVFHDDYADDTRREVSAAVETPSTIEWRSVDRDVVAHSVPAPHMPRASLFPLVVPQLLPPDVTRIIYLDVDLLVVQPLTDLWTTPIDDSAVAAVRGAFMPWFGGVHGFAWDRFGIADDMPYFNNGVMLVNVPVWRQQDLSSRALALLQAHAFPYGDQDALNVLLASRWQPLAPRWNLQSGHFGGAAVAWITGTVDEFEEAMTNPAIIHYNGAVKPWHHGCEHPLTWRWFEYLDRTRHRGWRPTGESGAARQMP
jgi:lipopolysaccharide biosynthesis glycosyltransferase